MSFYDICHDRARYDIITNQGVHTCSVCGRKWYCNIPAWKPGQPWEDAYWTSPPTPAELWRKFTGLFAR